MSGAGIGECWEVLIRMGLYNYAVENVLHFETIPGSWDGLMIANEVHDILMDQWVQGLSTDQTVRALYVRRLDLIHPVTVLQKAFPYKHGNDGTSEVFPQAAATLMFKSHSRARTDWSRKYWGALTAAGFDDGRLSNFTKTHLDGFGTYLMTNYGYPQLSGLTLITWSKWLWASSHDRNVAATRVTNINVSDRIAIIHSRRTGAGY